MPAGLFAVGFCGGVCCDEPEFACAPDVNGNELCCAPVPQAVITLKTMCLVAAVHAVIPQSCSNPVPVCWSRTSGSSLPKCVVTLPLFRLPCR